MKHFTGLVLLAATALSGAQSAPINDDTNIDRASQRTWPAGPYSSVNTNHGILQTTIPLISLDGPGDTALTFSIYNRTFQETTGYPNRQAGFAGVMWQPSCIMAVGPGDGGPAESVGGNVSRGWDVVINGSAHTFTRKPGNQASIREVLSGSTVTGYVVTDLFSKNETYYQENMGGTFFRVTKQKDTHGNTITWSYDPLHRVTRMTDSAGRYIQVNYVDGSASAQIGSVQLVTPQKTLS